MICTLCWSRGIPPSADYAVLSCLSQHGPKSALSALTGDVLTDVLNLEEDQPLVYSRIVLSE